MGKQESQNINDTIPKVNLVLSKFHLDSIKMEIEKYRTARSNMTDLYGSLYYTMYLQNQFLTKYMINCGKFVNNLDLSAYNAGQTVFEILKHYLFVNNLDGMMSDSDIFAEMLRLDTVSQQFSTNNIQNQILFIPATRLDVVGSR